MSFLWSYFSDLIFHITFLNCPTSDLKSDIPHVLPDLLCKLVVPPGCGEGPVLTAAAQVDQAANNIIAV